MSTQRSVAPPRHPLGRGRWSLPLLAAVIAVIVVAGALSNYFITQRAYEATVEGQGMLLDSAVSSSLAQATRPPTAAVFEELLEDNRELGLTYCGMVTPRGDVIAQAGQPSSPPEDWDQPEGKGRSVSLAPDSTLARLVSVLPPPPMAEGLGPRPPGAIAPPSEHKAPPEFNAPPERKTPPSRPGLDAKRLGRGPLGRHRATVRCEFQPTIGEELRVESLRTLSIGFATAGTLLLVAFGLWRASLRAEAAEENLLAQRHLASLGQMSAVLAHELRNPLSSLKGHAQLLEEMLEGRSRDKASRVVTEAKRLEALLSSLLAFVRSGAIEPTNADPREVARDAATEFRELEGLTIDDDASPGSWCLDATRVRQVLVNLIDNAAKATDSPGEIVVTVAQEKSWLHIRVRDHGEGVRPEMREEIFEPFTTGRTHGTGLGLAVSRRIAELHGGTLTVSDADGGGALFELRLPKQPTAKPKHKRKRRISWQRS